VNEELWGDDMERGLGGVRTLKHNTLNRLNERVRHARQTHTRES